MDGVDIFSGALAVATSVVKQVRSDQYANETPDSEWDVRDLLGHIFYELNWVPDIVEGKTIEEVGSKYDGDLVGDEDGISAMAVRWQDRADQAEQAVNACDPDETAHLSYGDKTVDEYLKEAGGDQLIHAWDLGKAIGVRVTFDPELAQAVYDHSLPQSSSFAASGLFAAPIDVPADADIQTKLLALFGRDANWQPAPAAR